MLMLTLGTVTVALAEVKGGLEWSTLMKGHGSGPSAAQVRPWLALTDLCDCHAYHSLGGHEPFQPRGRGSTNVPVTRTRGTPTPLPRMQQEQL